MLKLTRIALAACASAAAMSAANAADMPIYIPEAPMPVPEMPIAVSGWYLRGDIGYKIYRNPSPTFNDPLTGPVPFSSNSIEETGMIGAGIGYKFNNFFRADLTVDYEWPAQFSGQTPCPTCTGFTYAREYADLSAWTTMVNGYVDLGNFSGISPYVGAGIGASYVTADNVHYVANGKRGEIPGTASKWNLAWAVMAGVGIEFSPNVALDVGYRYLDLGSGESPVLQGLTSRIKYEDLTAHELRVGLRYTIY
ncbi:outer membrane protein [Faunimonas sp. B44]|uniref:outer membrane protein n=1 Tax=Faunimonas sp. B44 TaxID=3461493 RepID=UPI004044BBAA